MFGFFFFLTCDTELKRNKKAKKNNPEREVDSSISSDHSCFVALVTASNLHKDALVLIPFICILVSNHSLNEMLFIKWRTLF